MSIKISNYIDVKQRALEMGCNIPTELAILPRNFDSARSRSELYHQNPVPTIRMLWRQAGLTETKIENKGERFPYVKDTGFGGWLGPIIYVSASLLKGNPDIISKALEVIAAYVGAWYRVIPREQKVKLDIVVELANGQGYRRLEYEGDVAGLTQLASSVHEVAGVNKAG